MSEDPIGYNSGDTNTHRYVMNNPVMYADPSGKELTFSGAILVGAVVGGIAGAVGELMFNDNASFGSVGSAAIGGAAGGATTVVGAGVAIIAGGSSAVGATIGAISGLLTGSAVNLITDPSTIPSPIKPHLPNDCR